MTSLEEYPVFYSCYNQLFKQDKCLQPDVKVTLLHCLVVVFFGGGGGGLKAVRECESFPFFFFVFFFCFFLGGGGGINDDLTCESCPFLFIAIVLVIAVFFLYIILLRSSV